MAIREATEADLPALLRLFRSYCEFYESDPSDEGLEEMIRATLRAPEDEAFVLVATDDDGEPVGFAANQWKWSSLRGTRMVLMDDLFVAESARGAGHADALIEASAEVARRHGSPVLFWYTAKDNRRAQAVYNRVGGIGNDYMEFELEL